MKTRQRDDRATLLPGNESLSVREWGVSIQRIAEKAALKISTHSKAMLVDTPGPEGVGILNSSTDL
ncbi:MULTISPECIES: hypothetical protein [unclassified Microcoleus]|uniref:hypothetical protein n=1 Tax=unclassified Microcoleus TaxID=2642155 RepID=UPI002FD48871